MLPIVVDKEQDQMCFLLVNQTKNDHDEYLVNIEEFKFYIDSSYSLKIHPSIYELIEKPYEFEDFGSTDITIYYRAEYFVDQELMVNYIAEHIIPDLTTYHSNAFEDIFWAAESTQLFFQGQLIDNKNEELINDYNRAIAWYDIASYFMESEINLQACRFDEIIKTAITEKVIFYYLLIDKII